MPTYRIFKASGENGAKAGVWVGDDGHIELVVRNKEEQEVRIPASEAQARLEMNQALRDPDWYIKNKRLR